MALHGLVTIARPLVEWLFMRDSVSGRAPILRALPALVVGIAIAAYAWFFGGKAAGSTVFLGIAAALAFQSMMLLYGVAISLFTEPPAVELAVATGRRRKELEREKASLLKALKELEFDHEMRKVSDVDFAEIGGQYRARAIRVMRQLDDRQVEYSTLVEEELLRHKRGGRKIETKIDVPVKVSVVNACTQCGTANDVDAVFCKKCAHRLAGSSSSEVVA